jgi:microcystin-dependent protein
VGPFIGEIRRFASPVPPNGWVPCDGRLLPIGGGDGRRHLRHRRQRPVPGELVMEALAGEIRLFAGSYASDGWYACDGSLCSIDDDVELFNVIGTTYGGDGTTTFATSARSARSPLTPA